MGCEVIGEATIAGDDHGALVRPVSTSALLRDRPARSSAVKRAAVLTADQISAMLAAASPRDAALVVLMCVGAMRVGEATLLAWSDVDACTIAIPGQITKTGHGRTFTLPPVACQWLQQWREVCPTTKKGWVFPGQAGQPLSVRGAQVAITKLAETVGIEGVSSHSFRRSALTAAHQAGLSLREVAEISGHRSLAALERYLDQDAAREKAEAARCLLVG
jgi:integrase/recombinase XerD